MLREHSLWSVSKTLDIESMTHCVLCQKSLTLEKITDLEILGAFSLGVAFFSSTFAPHEFFVATQFPWSANACIAYLRQSVGVSVASNTSWVDVGVSKNNGTPKSSILIGFSIINHPFWGTPIFGNTHVPCQLTACWVFRIALGGLCNLFPLQLTGLYEH